jgi:hypothetical protein
MSSTTASAPMNRDDASETNLNTFATRKAVEGEIKRHMRFSQNYLAATRKQREMETSPGFVITANHMRARESWKRKAEVMRAEWDALIKEHDGEPWVTVYRAQLDRTGKAAVDTAGRTWIPTLAPIVEAVRQAGGAD